MFDLGSADPRILNRFFQNPIDLGAELDAAEAREVEKTHLNIFEKRARDLSVSEVSETASACAEPRKAW